MIVTQRKWSSLFVAIIHVSLATFFGICFYDRFWVWRNEIAQVKTSFITPDGSNVTSAGMVWVIPASVFALLGATRMARFVYPTKRIEDTEQASSSDGG